MGFGTLFFGYFLLLNVTFYSYSDIISAFLMLYAFYKLSSINAGFKRAFYTSALFAVFGLCELIMTVVELFVVTLDVSAITSWTTMIRCLIVCILTMFMLIGMRDVCREVELGDLSVRCNKAIYVTVFLYSLNIFWETGALAAFNLKVVAIIGYLILISTLILIAVNLASIHTCYVRICMPGDEKPKTPKEKKSRFGFVNAFRKHEEEKRREYYEYKIEKLKARSEKIKNKNNEKKK
jgi:hypothetical protein